MRRNTPDTSADFCEIEDPTGGFCHGSSWPKIFFFCGGLKISDQRPDFDERFASPPEFMGSICA
jgi:hypothetical protein